SVSGSGDTIDTWSNTSFNLAGGSDNVGLGGSGDYLGLLGGSGYSVSGQGDTIDTWGNTGLNLAGANDNVGLGGTGDYLGLLGGTGYSVSATGDTIATLSNTQFSVSGNSDTLGLGSSDSVQVNGSGDSVSGSSDSVTVNGQNDSVSGNSDAVDIVGSNSGDSMSGSGDSLSGDTSGMGGDTSSPAPESAPGIDYFGYYGFAGNQTVVNAAVGSSIGSIAQYDLSQGDQAAAAAAETGLHQADEIATSTPTSGTGSSVLEGAKWDSEVVTWSLATLPGTSSTQFSNDMGSQYAAEVQQAFATWGAASGITFEEVADSSQSDIRLGWSNLGTATTGVVGYTSFQAQNGAISPDAIIQLEDPSQDALATGTDGQQTYTGTDATLSQVLLHEIGHALGLADSADQNSIMYYELNSANRTLDATDIAGIQSLYGAGSTDTSVTQLIQAMSAFAPSTSAQSSVAIADQFATPQDLAVH
ncbi:UNVERIFIED_ORG: hypothetical protein ABIC62_006283, partial [Burkholderia sp. 1595]